MRILYKITLSLTLLGASVSFVRAERMRDVIVYSFVTEAGKKLTPPTPDHPATCLLVAGGYREEGETVAGEKPPPPEKVEQLVRKALAAASYQSATKDSKELNYIIVYHWGYMNPEIISIGGDGSDGVNMVNSALINKPMMIALVAGPSIEKMNPGFSDYNDTMQAAYQKRYFIVISAYSPAAYFKNHGRQKKLLWRAQMSLDSDGTNQTESIPALVSASVPYLGRETDFPKQIIESMERPSNVIIGAPELKEFIPAIQAKAPSGSLQKN